MDSQSFDFVADKTVRAPFGETWATEDRLANVRPNNYRGPDNSSLRGAKALAQRLEAYWAARGESRRFDTYRAGEDSDGHSVFGVRQLGTKAPHVAATPRRERECHKRLSTYARHILATYYPDVTLDEVRGDSKKPRIVSARKYVARRLYGANVAQSFAHLSRFMKRDHSTVWWIIHTKKRAKKEVAQ